MTRTLTLVLASSVALVAGATFAAPNQQDRPGLISQARVLIENRGIGEAVPVSLHDAVLQKPLSVDVAGAITIDAASVVSARLVRQAWEYRTVNARSAQELQSMLTAEGNEGWEAVTVRAEGAFSSVLLKRPRNADAGRR